MESCGELAWDLDRDGVEIVRGVLDAASVDELRSSAPRGRAGVRDPLHGWADGVRAATRARELLSARSGGKPVLTRAILFDKRVDANWGLPLHRDLSIAVRERGELPGFGPWSVKDGIPHVAPPLAVLAAMVTVRLHLDDADVTNGCLRFVPGSHRRAAEPHSGSVASTCDAIPLRAAAGDAVLMKPLVLHGSERTRSDARRRVLHLEFAFEPLPAPLAWAAIELDDPRPRSNERP